MLSLAIQYGRPDVILTYNLNPGYVLAGYLMAMVWRVPIVPVAADVNPPHSTKPGLRSIDARLQIALLRQMTGVIVFSTHTVKDFFLAQPTIKVEPGVESTDFSAVQSPMEKTTKSKIVMFSGALSTASGIIWLLEAFKLVDDPDLQLWITGRGHLESLIAESARSVRRVRFFGFVTKEELLQLYSSATVLVNPRPISLPEHQYNFPSKLIQYMATGRPVITTATGDVGEYESLVFLLREETPLALARMIQEVCALPAEIREELGERARNYVLRNKTWEIESRRMYEFLEQLMNNAQ